MGLLHVRGVLIPTLNELANGSPFTLTPFPHTFTHRALLAYPLGHRRWWWWEDRLDSLSPLQLGRELDIFPVFKRHTSILSELLSRVFQGCTWLVSACSCQRHWWFHSSITSASIFLTCFAREGWVNKQAETRVCPAKHSHCPGMFNT